VKEVYIGSPELEPQVRGLVSVGKPIVTVDGIVSGASCTEIYDIDGYREYLRNALDIPLEVFLVSVFRNHRGYVYFEECESGIMGSKE
jgi:hypothetical protein